MQDLCLFDVARPQCAGTGAVTAAGTAETVAGATLRAYDEWASRYPPIAHNPLMRAEQRIMTELWPEVAGRRALDLACGSGRYSRLLARTHAREVVAADFCAPMLAQVSGPHRVCADMMRLPFGAGVFDVAISGLALGHAARVDLWMAEVARVLRPGGVLLYSDFHPEAARAGLPRTFKDQNDRVVEVPHSTHELAAQREAAAAAQLTIDAMREVRVGIELQEPFAQCDAFYRRWHGLPLVLIVRARK